MARGWYGRYESEESDEYESENADESWEYLHDERAEIDDETTEDLEASIHERIEEVRELSDYWADRLHEMYDRIKNWERKRLPALKEAYPSSEEPGLCDMRWFETVEYNDYKEKLNRFHMTLDMAVDGRITWDEIGEVSDAYDEMLEHGDEYFKSEESLLEKMDRLSFEEADAILEEGYDDGKYTQSQYNSLKRVIRQRFGV